ncbi:MAG TPA: hypothetical protein VEQ61_08375, partial [Thermoleophilaceae bacterium]|nr:hypothetical protein [Thermoleophilaceae bacterium]
MRLVGHPRPAELRDYARASEEIEARLGELPGVLAVYRFGGVSAPGISDVDRLAVVDVDAPVPPVWATLTEATRALSLHPPFLVDPVTFAGHRLISQLEPLELASGSAIGLQERPEPGYVARLLGAESLLLNVVRLVKYRVTGRVKVRSVLCQLHTVRHGLELAGLDRAGAPAAWALSDEVSALRCAWFALAPKRREGQLRQLVLAALPALLAALDS